jgi:hypothetical protein
MHFALQWDALGKNQKSAGKPPHAFHLTSGIYLGRWCFRN